MGDWTIVLNFDERFREMPKLARVVLEKFQYDLHNDEPLRMNAELFWRCAIPSAQCWRYAQWRTETKSRRKVTHIGQSICTNCGVGAEFCSYVQTVLTIGHIQLQKGVLGLKNEHWGCKHATSRVYKVPPLFTIDWLISYNPINCDFAQNLSTGFPCVVKSFVTSDP